MAKIINLAPLKNGKTGRKILQTQVQGFLHYDYHKYYTCLIYDGNAGFDYFTCQETF